MDSGPGVLTLGERLVALSEGLQDLMEIMSSITGCSVEEAMYQLRRRGRDVNEAAVRLALYTLENEGLVVSTHYRITPEGRAVASAETAV